MCNVSVLLLMFAAAVYALVADADAAAADDVVDEVDAVLWLCSLCAFPF